MYKFCSSDDRTSAPEVVFLHQFLFLLGFDFANIVQFY